MMPTIVEKRLPEYPAFPFAALDRQDGTREQFQGDTGRRPLRAFASRTASLEGLRLPEREAFASIGRRGEHRDNAGTEIRTSDVLFSEENPTRTRLLPRGEATRLVDHPAPLRAGTFSPSSEAGKDHSSELGKSGTLKPARLNFDSLDAVRGLLQMPRGPAGAAGPSDGKHNETAPSRSLSLPSFLESSKVPLHLYESRAVRDEEQADMVAARNLGSRLFSSFSASLPESTSSVISPLPLPSGSSVAKLYYSQGSEEPAIITNSTAERGDKGERTAAFPRHSLPASLHPKLSNLSISGTVLGTNKPDHNTTVFQATNKYLSVSESSFRESAAPLLSTDFNFDYGTPLSESSGKDMTAPLIEHLSRISRGIEKLNEKMEEEPRKSSFSPAQLLRRQ